MLVRTWSNRARIKLDCWSLYRGGPPLGGGKGIGTAILEDGLAASSSTPSTLPCHLTTALLRTDSSSQTRVSPKTLPQLCSKLPKLSNHL